MIEVVHLISSLEAGGAQTMLYNLVAASDRRRFRHRVITMLDEGPNVGAIRALGIRVDSLGMRRGAPSARGAFRFARLVRHAAPDVLQTWLYHADLLGLLGGIVTGAAVVWNIRSSFHSGLDSAVTRWCARLSRWPSAIVVNSEAGRCLHASRGYHPRSWRLIGNGFDLDLFRPSADARVSVRRELGIADDAPLVGLIARFDPLKDHATFFQAAGRLARTNPSVRFLLAGEDVTADTAQIRESVCRASLEDRVHLLGLRADVPRLTAALDVSSCTSTGEGFPNVVGEAMACGVPCVVTDVGDAAAIVGPTGYVVQPGDAAALADAWARVLAMSPAERLATGRAARQRIADHYSLAAIVHEYEALYGSLTKHRHSGEPRS